MVKVCTNRGKIAVCKDAVMNLNLFLKYVHYSHPPTKQNGRKYFLKESSYRISIILKEKNITKEMFMKENTIEKNVASKMN